MKKILLNVVLILLINFSGLANNPISVGYLLDSQEKFTQIEIANMPNSVGQAIQKYYPKASIEKVETTSDNSLYKISLCAGNLNATVYSDANGNFISH